MFQTPLSNLAIHARNLDTEDSKGLFQAIVTERSNQMLVVLEIAKAACTDALHHHESPLQFL